MRINVATGYVQSVTAYESPHQNDRPNDADIRLVVVHGISLPPGEFDGTDVIDLFMGCLPATRHPYYAGLKNVQVSAHVFIRRTGELIQFVPFHRRAWHAGTSRFGTATGCNDFSIGIELEGTDTCAYTDQQYDQLASLWAALKVAYPQLHHTPIVGHADIAPGRKTDPGLQFDWSRLQ